MDQVQVRVQASISVYWQSDAVLVWRLVQVLRDFGLSPVPSLLLPLLQHFLVLLVSSSLCLSVVEIPPAMVVSVLLLAEIGSLLIDDGPLLVWHLVVSLWPLPHRTVGVRIVRIGRFPARTLRPDSQNTNRAPMHRIPRTVL